MRVYISVDAEGISGIIKLSQVVPGNQDYSYFRKMMAGDVNAAIKAAFNAGATEVVVNDAHNCGDNLLIDQIDKRAKLISGFDRPNGMMEGIDKGFEAALFVGYHSRKGNKGVISHTCYYSSIIEVKINKKPVAEYEINGLFAGYFNVPVVFISGDDVLIKDAKENVQGIYTTVTKEAIGHSSALCYHPEITHSSIEENVEKALKNLTIDNIKPMILAADRIELEIKFANSSYAEYASWIPGFELIEPSTVKFIANNYMETYKGFITAITIASAYRENI